MFFLPIDWLLKEYHSHIQSLPWSPGDEKRMFILVPGLPVLKGNGFRWPRDQNGRNILSHTPHPYEINCSMSGLRRRISETSVSIAVPHLYGGVIRVKI